MNILLIDDNQRIFPIMKENLEIAGYQLFYASNTKQAFKQIQINFIDVILLDIKLGNENGVETLKKLKKLDKEIPVIMITGFASVDTAVTSMKEGAFDYLKKPLNFNLLCQLIEKAIEASSIKQENSSLKKLRINDLPNLTSLDGDFQNTIERAKLLANSDFPVLITGENGTGKELLAECIHRYSKRSSQKLHKINCAAFPESLLDNELFGHNKGSFTGAESDFKGIFEQANNATLFLDEIGDMPSTIQVKILRVLQNNEIRRIGGDKTIKVNIRFIAATNKNLQEQIDIGNFRKDLFYRLNTASLQIPPLRNRRKDINLLAKDFLEEYNIQNEGTKKFFSSEVLKYFENYNWPGNVRELKNVVHYSYTISRNDSILIDDLPPSLQKENQDLMLENDLSLFEQQQIKMIKKALQDTGNNKTEAAKLLKISRNTLYFKIKKYRISHGQK